MNIQITIKGDCSNMNINGGGGKVVVNQDPNNTKPNVGGSITINGVKQDIPQKGVVVFNGNVISGGDLVIYNNR